MELRKHQQANANKKETKTQREVSGVHTGVKLSQNEEKVSYLHH